MTKLFLFMLVVAVTLVGCTNSLPSAHSFSSSDATGRTLRDKDGCAFLVTYNSSYGHIDLQPLVDESASTCKLFEANADPTPAHAQSVN